jgi:hypothetical protein
MDKIPTAGVTLTLFGPPREELATLVSAKSVIPGLVSRPSLCQQSSNKELEQTVCMRHKITMIHT